ncbi:uncharacterized protein [Palaemon carinicauda]|uniref:uncharacterized protein n=1 Tax=Palaemon carinicauda TaxID=392227 RepID=UPI0035B6AAC5
MDCGQYTSGIVSSDMREAAKELRKEVNVIVRRADKTAAFVLIDTEVYQRKLDLILGISSKFEKLSYNPIEENKREANKTTETINAVPNSVYFLTIIGDLRPSYLYGNVRTHKNGNPLRPIISQCPMPTYHLDKRLNSILTPYVLDKYSVASSAKFSITERIDQQWHHGFFTNVPVGETIELNLESLQGPIYSYP